MLNVTTLPASPTQSSEFTAPIKLAGESLSAQPTEIKPAVELKAVGDFEIVRSISPNQTALIRVVTHVEHTRGWTHCNPGLSDPHLNQSVSFPIDTPTIKEFTGADLAQKIRSDTVFMNKFLRGKFDALIKDGLLDATGIIDKSEKTINEQAVASIDAILEKTALNDGKTVYYTSRALVAKSILSGVTPQLLVNAEEIVQKHDWLPSWVPGKVTQALFGESADIEKVYSKGAELEQRNNRDQIIAGWALLAAAATTPERRQEAYNTVMKNVDTLYFDMGSNVLIAAGILGDSSQRQDIFARASNIFSTSKYWTFKCGALIAKAITAPTQEAKQEVFLEASEHIKRNHYGYTKSGMLAMALSAQSPEEKQSTLQIAQNYANSNVWNNINVGWSMIALGILGSNDRELALKSVAAIMEDPD